jgi:Ca2+-binding RTX toxin-like protein
MTFDANTIGAAPIFTIAQATDEFHDLTGADVDIFGVELEAGRIYRVGTDPLDGAGNFANTFDPYLRIFNEAGVEVFATDDGAGATALGPGANFAPNYSGTYYFGFSMNGNTQYDPLTGANTIVGTPGGGDADVFFDDLRSTTYSAINSANAAPTWLQLQDDDRQVRVIYERAAPAFGVDVAKHFLEKGDVVVADINSVGFPETAVRVVDPDDTTILSQVFANSSNGDDGEVVFTAREDGAHAIGPITSGTGTAGAEYELILHLNPTLIGDASANVPAATSGDDYAVTLSGADTLDLLGGDDVGAGGDGNDRLTGGGGNDQLYGENQNDILVGNAGSDALVGGRGDDDLSGGPDADILEGGRGDDTLAGGQGEDTLRGGDGADDLNGQGNDDAIFGDDGDDTISGAGGNDVIEGGGGADRINGNDGRDVIDGGAGADVVGGGDGNDTLDGGAGDDVVAGGAGNDVVDGGPGADILRGRAGNDIFDFDAVTDGIDRIADFEVGADRIDLSDILVGATSQNYGDYILLSPAGGDTRLFVDPDGATGPPSFTELARVDDVGVVALDDPANFIL